MDKLFEQVKQAALDTMSRRVDIYNDADVIDVLAFADKAHQHKNDHTGLHFRKYPAYLPYIVHPIRVSNIVRIAGGTIAQRQAALLHDVVEDTLYTLADIRLRFGEEVADMVNGITDQSGPPTPGRNRALRKAEDREHSISQPGKTQTIKYADLIDNTFDIVYHDPNFAVVYLKEKEKLLEGLDKGDPGLRVVTYQVLVEAQQLLTATKKEDKQDELQQT